jgi:hypothetical protein
MTVKLNNENGLQQRTDRRPTGKIGLAIVGLKEVIEHLEFYVLN